MTYKTKGLVLRTIKYGETSVIVTIFTELFGVQSYLINGVRLLSKTGSKAAMYQPAALLNMEVYHNELKPLQRIKECSWATLYINIFSDVIKNCIALYMVELLYKTLKQPEQNTSLFYFCEDVMTELDRASVKIAANFPLFFSLQLAGFLGFKLQVPILSPTDESSIFIDLNEGAFTTQQPHHSNFISGDNAVITMELLKIMHPAELDQVALHHTKRRELILKYQEYYALHIADFGKLKTLQVMQEVLG